MAIELWSWLKKDAKRQRFYCEDGCDIDSAEFMEKVSAKMIENDVPATINKTTVKWDRSSQTVNANMIMIDVGGVVNPFSCLVQFNKVGKYAFVEEKLFITPPNLPEPPKGQKHIDEDLYKKRGLILWGGAAIVAGLIIGGGIPGILVMAVGALLGYIGVLAYKEIVEAQKHNAWYQKVLLDWNKEWDRWEETIFIHSFQEGTNGRLSRIYDAIYDCIMQVCTELFEGKSLQEDDETNSISELEQLIAKRKEEYK